VRAITAVPEYEVRVVF